MRPKPRDENPGLFGAVMRNTKRKPMTVVLLDEHGNEIPGAIEVLEQGPAGVRLKGRVNVLPLSDKGRTWKPTEDAK